MVEASTTTTTLQALQPHRRLMPTPSPNSTPSPTPSPSPMRRAQYRGIFSSSLCGMFETPAQSRTDACALACCGIWLWERNQFLLSGTTIKPKSWKKRRFELALLGIGIILLVVLVYNHNDDDDNNNSQYPNSVISKCLVFVTVVGVVWRLLQFQQARNAFRIALAKDQYARENPTELDHGHGNHHQLQGGQSRFLHEHQREIQRSHPFCGCHEMDVAVTYEESDGPSSSPSSSSPPPPSDFCSVLWQCLASTCCGTCCRCWCQFCGMCAIAQEHRHLRRVLLPNNTTPDLWQRDYMTFQPWTEYFPTIQQLRDSAQGSFFAHAQALSQLSLRLSIGVHVILVVILVATLLPLHLFSAWNFLVLLGTLFQPMLILYFVYWFWNRFDISLDAIIKFFASGFVIATSMAMVYEMLVSAVTSIAVSVTALFGAVTLALLSDLTITFNENDDDDLPQVLVPSKFAIVIAMLTAFLNAFVVAALVEELAKYLCFWMVEHPDIPDASYETTIVDDAEEALLPQQSLAVSRESRSSMPFVSRGAAITIAMVTTALGFACAENILYVFVYAPPGVATEVSTLLARSLFPVHPLAAALQSIGVCRRDLECDSSTGVGRILLPAWILHGSFDFVLMAAEVWSQVHQKYKDQGDDGTNNQVGSEVVPNESSADTAEDSTDTLPALIASVTIQLVGIAYYVVQARSQRKRLEALDQEHRQYL